MNTSHVFSSSQLLSVVLSFCSPTSTPFTQPHRCHTMPAFIIMLLSLRKVMSLNVCNRDSWRSAVWEMSCVCEDCVIVWIMHPWSLIRNVFNDNSLKSLNRHRHFHQSKGLRNTSLKTVHQSKQFKSCTSVLSFDYLKQIHITYLKVRCATLFISYAMSSHVDLNSWFNITC